MKYRVELHPGFKVFNGTEELRKLPTKKSSELLRFLIDHRGRRFSREVLQTQFWATSGSHHAQLGLRQAIFAIQKLFPEGSPIVSDRKEVYCRSSMITIVDDRNQAHEDRSGNQRSAQDNMQTELLSAFRREPVDRFFVRVLEASRNKTISRETMFQARFFLAYAYNETGRYREALSAASSMLSDAHSIQEKVLSKHALGGILWHSGHFDQGIRELWEATDIAHNDPDSQVHILTNIAIGAFEAKHVETIEYSIARAKQIQRSNLHPEFSIALGYATVLEQITHRDYKGAMARIENLLRINSADSHRINVYLLEALATIQSKSGLTAEARATVRRAFQLRKSFLMMSTPVETQRLLRLKTEIKRASEPQSNCFLTA